MKLKILLQIAASVGLTTCLVNGQYIAQNGGGIVTNNLTAINGPDSVSDFYNYAPYEFGGSMVFDDQSINTFLYQEDGGALSFLTIYGNAPTLNNSAFSIINLSGTTASFSVQDDPPGGADDYTNTGGILFSASNLWQANVTDGFAITDVTGFSMLTQSMDADYTTWFLHSGNSDDPFELTLDTDLVLTPVPEPATIGLVALLFIPLALIVRRKLVRKTDK